MLGGGTHNRGFQHHRFCAHTRESLKLVRRELQLVADAEEVVLAHCRRHTDANFGSPLPLPRFGQRSSPNLFGSSTKAANSPAPNWALTSPRGRKANYRVHMYG